MQESLSLSLEAQSMDWIYPSEWVEEGDLFEAVQTALLYMKGVVDCRALEQTVEALFELMEDEKLLVLRSRVPLLGFKAGQTHTPNFEHAAALLVGQDFEDNMQGDFVKASAFMVSHMADAVVNKAQQVWTHGLGTMEEVETVLENFVSQYELMVLEEDHDQ